MARISRTGVTALFLSLGALAPAFSHARAGGPPADPKEFIVHWNVVTDANEYKWRAHKDWSSMIQFNGTPIRRDTVIFYQQNIGNVNYTGPTNTAYNPAALQRHAAKVRDDVLAAIPDAGFDGIGVIDLEAWPPIYTFASPEIKQAWRAFMYRTDPDRLRGLTHDQVEADMDKTYAAAAREFLETTINSCRAARPNAKWTYYGMPDSWQSGEYDFPEPNPYRGINNRLQWLWDSMDLLAPALYSWKYTVEDGKARNPKTEWSPAEQKRYVESTIREARRLANGKPVVAYFWSRYEGAAGRHHNELILSATVKRTFDLAKSAGADGMIIWDHLKSDADYQSLNSYVQANLFPAVAATATTMNQHKFLARNPGSVGDYFRPGKPGEVRSAIAGSRPDHPVDASNGGAAAAGSPKLAAGKKADRLAKRLTQRTKPGLESARQGESRTNLDVATVPTPD